MRARNLDLDIVRIPREETPALRRPALLPLLDPEGTAPHAEDRALTMERMP